MISDSRYMISASLDKTIRIWNIEERRLEAVLGGHTDEVTSLVITSDRKFIVSNGSDNTVRLWNVQGRKQEAAFTDLDAALKWNSKYPDIAEIVNNLYS